jgi:predicted nucleic acid-binding protein
MNPVFADTFYFLALRNPRDAAYSRAKTVTQQVKGRTLVTTAWVLTEIGDALAAPANRAGFAELL